MSCWTSAASDAGPVIPGCRTRAGILSAHNIRHLVDKFHAGLDAVFDADRMLGEHGPDD
jgi:hypothetical protein